MHQIALSAGKVEQGREKIRPEIQRTQLKNTLTAKKNLNQGGALGAHCLCNMHTKEKICATHFTSIEGTVFGQTSLGHSVELDQNQSKLNLVFLCAFLRLWSNGFNHRNCFNWTVDLTKGHKSSQQFN